MMKYIDYIKVSGGGITVTGGEPVSRPILWPRCSDLQKSRECIRRWIPMDLLT